MSGGLQPWLDRVVDVCRSDDRVLAVLLVGSHAAGRADAFSDIDIALVTTDADHQAVVADLERIVRDLGDPLFDEDFDDPSNRHVIYADGTSLEVMAWPTGAVSIDGPFRVLFDRANVSGGIAAGRSEPRDGPASDEATEATRRRIVWFWHDVEHLVTALGRGQTWWAYGQLDILRGVCLDLARIAEGAGIEPGEPYWKVDTSIAPSRLAALEPTVVPLDEERILAAAIDLVDVYRGLARELADARALEYPAALDRLVSDRLVALRDRRPA